MQFLVVILIALIAGPQHTPELHTLINEVRAEYRAGDYVEALESYNEIVKPKLAEAPLNLEINARLLEVLILKKLGFADRGLDSIAVILPQIPESLPRHKMQALSHKANLHWDKFNLEIYKNTLWELYELAEQQQHGGSMNRAIGNLYDYYDVTLQSDSLEYYLATLNALLNQFPDETNQIRFHILSGKFERDYKANNNAALIEFGKASELIDPEHSYSWFQRLVFEQTKTWLSTGNLYRAEQELLRLGEFEGTWQDPNALAMYYSALVRMYATKGEEPLAQSYFEQLQRIPGDMLNYDSIEAGVLAKMAINGGDFWDLDPVFSYTKKSELNYLWMVWLLSGLLGVLLFGWLFPQRFSWLRFAFVHPQGPLQIFQSGHPSSEGAFLSKSEAYLSSAVDRLRSLQSRQ